jgi:uncharacterized membrane protein YphA (DoxX/SURF4 family)
LRSGGSWVDGADFHFGFGKLMAFDQTVSMMESGGFPLPAFFGAIVIEVIGQAALLLGYKAHWAGLVFSSSFPQR